MERGESGMGNYYTALIVLSWMSLGVLCILVWENSWIPREDKRRFYLTYGIIALSALMEWAGIQMNGRPGIPGWALALVKCADYSLTPMAGGAIVAQIKLRDRWGRALMFVLVFNVVFQVLSFFNNWMVVIDAENHYSHGPLYIVYVMVYLLVIGLTTVEFLIYGLSYRRQNRASLYSSMLLVIIGIGIQEVLGGEYRTAYIALTMGVALMFIHYSEFYQMSMGEHILLQRHQLMKDPLTGVFSRHAYMRTLEKYRTGEKIPDDLVAFTMDINGLKTINDTIGHEAGDEMIVGAAHCLEKVFGTDSACFRTGGDEFVILAQMERPQVEAALLLLERESRSWTGNAVSNLSFSTGYALASEHRNLTVEKLVREADQAMYAAKAEYYRKNGHDRRASR